MFKPGWKSGRWQAICDRCGFKFHSDRIKKEWTGLMVCDSCWETRNPQDFLRVVPEKIIPPWVRDEPSDNITYVCYIFYLGGADVAQADCATADTPYRTQ